MKREEGFACGFNDDSSAIFGFETTVPSFCKRPLLHTNSNTLSNACRLGSSSHRANDP